QEQKAKRNLIQKLEKESDALLMLCDELREKIAFLDGEMAKPEVYSDAIKITSLVAEKEKTEALLEEKEGEWFELSERIEREKEALSC
ncbi:MAG: ABC transporter C-terminal domain-containing protein, partial [Bullifex sp.]